MIIIQSSTQWRTLFSTLISILRWWRFHHETCENLISQCFHASQWEVLMILLVADGANWMQFKEFDWEKLSNRLTTTLAWCNMQSYKRELNQLIGLCSWVERESISFLNWEISCIGLLNERPAQSENELNSQIHMNETNRNFNALNDKFFSY